MSGLLGRCAGLPSAVSMTVWSVNQLKKLTGDMSYNKSEIVVFCIFDNTFNYFTNNVMKSTAMKRGEIIAIFLHFTS